MAKRKRPGPVREPPVPRAAREAARPDAAPDARGLWPGPPPGRAWTVTDLSGARVRLEYDSVAEDSLLIACLMGGLAGLAFTVGGGFLILGGKADSTDRGLFLGGCLQLLLVSGLGWIRYRLDETLVLDNEAMRIDNWRAVGAWVDTSTVARFDQIACVAVRGVRQTSKYGSWWSYCPLLVLRDGTRVPLGEGFKDQHGPAEQSARALARHLGVPVFPGGPEGTVVVKALRPDGPPEVEWVPYSDTEGCLAVLGLLAAMLLTVGAGPVLGALLASLLGTSPAR